MSQEIHWGIGRGEGRSLSVERMYEGGGQEREQREQSEKVIEAEEEVNTELPHYNLCPSHLQVCKLGLKRLYLNVCCFF